MQSSPPTHASTRPPSPAGSAYSLDLGALGLDGDDTASSLPQQKIDRIDSRDIDGPSDFTLNMGRWMRDGSLKPGTARGDAPRSALQRLQEQQDKAEASGRQVMGLDSSQAVRKDRLPEGERTRSRHTPESNPPREPVGEEEHQPCEEGEEGETHSTSDWDPYTEASRGGTPQPPAHKQFLQPTVEDYYSELTPARISPAPRQLSPRQSQSPTEVHVSPSKSASSSFSRQSSPTLSPIRSPAISHTAAPSATQFPAQSLHIQLQQLQARCQRLEGLNSDLKQALDEEKRACREERAMREMQAAEAARLECNLKETKVEIGRRTEDFRDEEGELRKSLRKAEADAAAAKQEAERRQQQQRDDIEMLKDELENRTAAHERALQANKAELEQTRRGREEAEEATRVHREELEEARDAYEAELERIKRELQKAEGVRTTIAELNAELAGARDEIASLRLAKTEADGATNNLWAELAGLRQGRDDEAMRNSAEHLQELLKNMQQQLRDQQSTHQTELARLRVAHDQAQASTNAELKTVGARVDAESDQSLLNDAIVERDAAQDSLSALQAAQDTLKSEFDALKAENEHLRAQMDDADAVNTALNDRISDALHRRETYWKGRLEESEKERRLMAKMLMHQWGREEVGPRLPQSYEYRFATRSSLATKVGGA